MRVVLSSQRRAALAAIAAKTPRLDGAGTQDGKISSSALANFFDDERAMRDREADLCLHLVQQLLRECRTHRIYIRNCRGIWEENAAY